MHKPGSSKSSKSLYAIFAFIFALNLAVSLIGVSMYSHSNSESSALSERMIGLKTLSSYFFNLQSDLKSFEWISINFLDKNSASLVGYENQYLSLLSTMAQFSESPHIFQLQYAKQINQELADIKTDLSKIRLLVEDLLNTKKQSKNNRLAIKDQLEQAQILLKERITSIDFILDNELSEAMEEQTRSADLNVTRMKFTMLAASIVALALVAMSPFVIRRLRRGDDISEFYKYAIDQSAIVAVTDRKGKITYANNFFSVLSGYTLEELLGRDHRILNSGIHDKEFFKNLWNTISRGEIWRGEVRNQKKTGEHYWVESTIVPMLDSNGKPTQFVAIRSDITLKKDLEDKLRQSEETFALAIDAISVGLWEWNLVENIEKWSARALLLLGYSQEEAKQVEGNLFEKVYREDKKMVDTMIRKHFSSGHDLDLEVRLLCKQGDHRWFRMTAKTLCDSDNKPVRMVASIMDIHDRKIHEKELGLGKEKAERSAQTKSQFLANMSHEIRTPINGILGMATLLTDENISSEGKHYLHLIKKSGESLLAIINDILDFSKIEAGKIIVEDISFEFRVAVADALELLQFKAKEKGLFIKVQIEEEIPRYCMADVTRFKQVLTNLVNNAIKFTNSGSIELKAKLISQHPDDSLKLQVSVSDSGVGIDSEAKEKLFRAFSQVDASTTRMYGGTGLGLSICKGICEAMGGKIWVDSELGKGSTFTFEVLVKKSSSQHPSQDQIDNAHLSTIGPDRKGKKSLRILVADDHPTNQLLAIKFLNKLGYDADSAINGLEVLEAVGLKKYDIIIMDCQMPKMDGYETTKKIHALYGKQNSPWIIACTASVSLADRQNCLNIGMNDFIAKPFSLNSLKDVISHVSSYSPSLSEAELPTESMNNHHDSSIGINFEKLNNHFSGDEDVMLELAKMFLESLPLAIQKIKHSLETKDHHALSIAVHTLKGNVSNFFYNELKLMLAEMESHSRGQNLTEAHELFQKCLSHFELLKAQLTSLLEQKSVA